MHCEWRIYSPATTNQQPVSKLLSAVCVCASLMIELLFGVAEISTVGSAQNLCRLGIRLWCARAKNFQSILRRAGAARGSRFPVESTCHWCSVVAREI